MVQGRSKIENKAYKILRWKMLKLQLEHKNELRLTSGSILVLRDYNTESRLHDIYITIALQLPFFLDMSLIEHIGM